MQHDMTEEEEGSESEREGGREGQTACSLKQHKLSPSFHSNPSNPFNIQDKNSNKTPHLLFAVPYSSLLHTAYCT